MKDVLRTNTKLDQTDRLTISDKAWDRIQKQSSTFGADLVWRLASKQIANDDIAKSTTSVADSGKNDDQGGYGEENYKYDCQRAKELVESEPLKAIEHFERALDYQPKNQYARRMLKKLKNESKAN